MAKAQIDCPMPIDALPRGQSFVLLFPETGYYNVARMGATVELVDETGKTIDAKVSGRKLDALGNVTGMIGGTFAPMVGKAYDIVAVGDHLDAMFPDNPRAASINELYTVITFEGLPFPQMPGQPTP